MRTVREAVLALNSQWSTFIFHLGADPKLDAGAVTVWMVNKNNLQQTLVLDTVRKYLVEHPHLFVERDSIVETPTARNRSVSNPAAPSTPLKATSPFLPVVDNTSQSEVVSDQSGYTKSLAKAEAQLQLEFATDLDSTATAPPTGPWVVHSRQHDIDVFVKTVGTIRYCKGVGVVPLPASVVAYVFRDTNRRGEWDEIHEQSQLIEHYRGEQDISVTYLSCTVPWPHTPRDFCIASRMKRQDDGAIWFISVSVNHVRCPPVEGRLRAQLVLGGTLVTPLGPTTCRVMHMAAVVQPEPYPEFLIERDNIRIPLHIDAVQQFVARHPSLPVEISDLEGRNAAASGVETRVTRTSSDTPVPVTISNVCRHFIVSISVNLFISEL